MSARAQLLAAAAERVLIFDGAFGTQIQNRKLTEADYAGDLGLTADQKGNNDILVLTRPDVIGDITRAYLDAGSDVVSTNTFSANRISQADYAAEGLVRDINVASGKLHRFSTGQALPNGVTALDSHGHTPGHVSWKIEGGEGQAVLLWGDIVHFHAVQFARPDASYEADSDRTAAIASRRRLCARFAQRPERRQARVQRTRCGQRKMTAGPMRCC